MHSGATLTLTKRIAALAGILYLLSQLLFLINIQFPRGYCFDEFHYVPSAKQYLNVQKNQNWEHPPLGKLIMSAGIAVGGDRPFGWRLMSTAFGALTVVGMFFLGLTLFRTESAAIFVAAVTVFNQLVYVQARIGMLDTFMFGFMVWGMVGFFAAWNAALDPRRVKAFLTFAGLMFGLATATKWYAIVPWVFCVGLIFMIRILQNWGVVFARPSTWQGKIEDFHDWYHPDLWHGVKSYNFAMALLGVPLLAYFSTFIPSFFMPEGPRSFWDVIVAQKTMWEGQLRVVSSHPYMSNWTGWALMLRPIWYAFDKEGTNGEFVRGVILLGNPLIMWTGLAALAVCVWGWLAHRSRAAFLIVAFYAVFYLSWGIIPRKVSFFYYYYPAGTLLSLAIGFVFHRFERGKLFPYHWARWMFIAMAVGVFAYFYPILAALKIPSENYRQWMWLSSWI